MIDLIKQAQDSLLIRLYGTEAFDFPQTNREETSALGLPGDAFKLIKVIAIGYGITTDHCIKVNPYYLMVGGPGKPAECNGSAFPETVKLWVVNKTATSTRLDSSVGSIEELIEPDLLADEDEITGGPIDLKLKPRLSVVVRERNDGNICIEYNASVEAFYRVFGSKWKKLASASLKGSECIFDNACINVFDQEFITGKICYRPDSNKICLEVKVGYKGVSIKATECFNL